ncbi:MAG: hypothetical protein KIT66_11430 [Chitinophagaceae bacterium]|nr:hypothetical protein [Chitinophagaceae bacterium]MCZ2396460.1 hypothetical protein [Chitinophagales bacterium]
MGTRVLLFSLVLCFWGHFTSAQKTSSSINFTEVWVWEYENADGKKGEMAIYREPKLNYWLITPDDAGFREKDEMSLWFLLKPNGEVLQAYLDAVHSSKQIMIHQLPLDIKRKLPGNWKARGKSEYFGDTHTGFPKMKGKEYHIRYEKSNEKTSIYLAYTNADAWVLPFFNDMNIDAKLPIRFPKDLPKNFVAVKEVTEYAEGGSVQYRFKNISHTEYYIDLNELK